MLLLYDEVGRKGTNEMLILSPCDVPMILKSSLILLTKIFIKH